MKNKYRIIAVFLAAFSVLCLVMIGRILYQDSRRETEMETLRGQVILPEEVSQGAEGSDPKMIESDKQADPQDEPANPFVSEDDPDAWYHQIDISFGVLKKVNPDIVGWIYFEGEEEMSYPLLYSGDDYYLSRNFLGEEERAGSIFMDGNNDPAFSDAHILLYGHNMKDGSMFGHLLRYKTDETYFDSHSYFQILTEEGVSRYQIFAYKDVGTVSGGIYTVYRYADEDFQRFVKNEICLGSYMDSAPEVGEDAQIVTLSTCSYAEDVRFIVSAIRVDQHIWY